MCGTEWRAECLQSNQHHDVPKHSQRQDQHWQHAKHQPWKAGTERAELAPLQHGVGQFFVGAKCGTGAGSRCWRVMPRRGLCFGDVGQVFAHLAQVALHMPRRDAAAQ